MQMQLRKRKRVDYTGKNSASDPSVTTIIPTIVVPKKRKLNKPGMIAPVIQSPTATLSSSNIIIPRPLQRPSFRNSAESPTHDDGLEVIPVLEIQKSLSSLIKRQESLFYKDLKRPTLVGLKNFEMLRLPNDLQLLQNIVNLLQSFDQLKSSNPKPRPAGVTGSKAFSQAHSNNLKKLIVEKNISLATPIAAVPPTKMTFSFTK